ncbi:glycoside hydrolase family 3 protein [Streptomyces sp. NPDC058459]|uniref:glycoside hydrolase family 3 protein n=1 Tax=Streptomyces sp. NPDC058459 TaxID=3346508 RepID=UPI00365D9219
MKLDHMAMACVLPGFAGWTAPDWVRRRIAEGLAGVVLYHGNVRDREQLAELTAQLRSENPQLLIAIDEEGGDVTRLDIVQGSRWPGGLALGAVDDTSVTHAVAQQIGAELANAGVNWNLAPVADVNTAAGNPVIGTRAFGADPDLVSRHTAAFVTGLQDRRVAACAKHFPGHGNTLTDSHLELPRIHQDRAAFEADALPPFRAAIAAGTASVMTAHIVVDAYGDLPATVNPAVLTGLLRQELGYDGVVITDSLEMQAVYGRYGVVEAAERAIAAGADALCVGASNGDSRTGRIHTALRDAVTGGRLPEQRLHEAAQRVARLAAWATAQAPGAVEPAIGIDAARRALTVTGTVRLSRPAAVIELSPSTSEIVGETGWGIGQLLARQIPATRVLRLTEEEAPPPALISADHQPVLVVRDAHRHPWIAAALSRLLPAHPDAVLIEMGAPHAPTHHHYIATNGASRVSAAAAVELLLGTAVDPA